MTKYAKVLYKTKYAKFYEKKYPEFEMTWKINQTTKTKNIQVNINHFAHYINHIN